MLGLNLITISKILNKMSMCDLIVNANCSCVLPIIDIN